MSASRVRLASMLLLPLLSTLLAPGLAGGASPGTVRADPWPGWGGPGGDFQVAVKGLGDRWPDGGPPEIWSRPLGKGYSAVAVGDGVLFTMYRDGGKESVVALNASDGKTRWEHRYPAPTRKKNAVQFGEGPNATPLLLTDRIVTLGYTGILSCLARKDGRLLWSHDLIREYDGEVLNWGNSASPIFHDGRILVLVGGAQGAMAFAPKDGSVIWRSPAGTVSYATPIVIDVDGQEQVVYFAADEVRGLDAKDGSLEWSYPCVNQYKNNATGALWGKDNLLWVATQTDGGTRVLRLGRDGDKTTVEQVWESSRLSIHFWNSIRLSDHVYLSVGGQATFLVAVAVKTGEIVWRERGFPKANLVQAGDRTLLFDESGRLAMVRLSPKGLEVVASAQIVEEQRTWTVPTLAGTTLYVRDQKILRALDLGA